MIEGSHVEPKMAEDYYKGLVQTVDQNGYASHEEFKIWFNQGNGEKFLDMIKLCLKHSKNVDL